MKDELKIEDMLFEPHEYKGKTQQVTNFRVASCLYPTEKGIGKSIFFFGTGDTKREALHNAIDCLIDNLTKLKNE